MNDGRGSAEQGTVRSYPKGFARRAAIIEVATEFFGRVGYRGATMLQIAAACGISRAGLLHHFPTKESLLQAVLSERDRTNRSRLAPKGAVDDDGLGALSDLVALTEHNSTIPTIVNLFAVLSAEAGDPSHPAHDYFLRRYDSARSGVQQALEQARDRGLVAPGVDPGSFAIELVALMDGLQVQWLLAPNLVDMAALLQRRIESALTVPLPRPGNTDDVTSDPVSPSERSGWRWDPTLYAGSAAHYSAGRVAYPAELAAEIVRALDLDGSGRLLDVGCGPGSLTLLLAPYFAEAIGVDADVDMLAEGARLAAHRGLSNLTWRHLRAEDLPADLPSVRVVTFAQAFHWMDRPRVAATVRTMLDEDGAVVHVHASTHQGVPTDTAMPHPQPPWAAVSELVQKYLGQRRRAGQGFVPGGTPGGEAEIYRGAGFTGPVRIEVSGRVVTRTIDDIAASVYSLSSSTPHLFGDRLPAFDSELRILLAEVGSDGLFSEQMRSTAADIWR